MGTVNGLTAERMIAIEASCIVDGAVVLDNLILTKHDGSTIDAGSVRGPVGSPGVSQPQLDTFMNDHLPVGSAIDWLGIAAPNAKWLAGIGQTIVNGQTLYPAFWAVIPVAMKSGANILMPDTRGRVVVGYDVTQTEFDAIGEIGGAKTHVLTQAQLPAATITIDPPLTAVTIVDPGHDHDIITGGGSGRVTPDGRYVDDEKYGLNTSIVGNPPIYHNTTGITASVDINSFPSGNLGSGTAHNNLQPYITFLKIIKVA